MSSTDRHQRAKDIFLEACEQAGPERARFLDRACAGDPGLRAEVDELLAFDTDERSFLETPLVSDREVLERMLDSSAERAAAAAAPSHIGHYRILRKIGEGGMGSVFEAEQQSPRRTVALKVLKPALMTDSMLRRFEFEAQLLGRLQHPGIAQIFEAGTEDGSGGGAQPYFAMELVRGLPLNQHASDHRLSVSERVRLLMQVCDAVEHAHRHGIIHRDLKPGNILVTESGEPKVLDFGVARATDVGADADAADRTRVGEVIGTLSYMSPEQALGEQDAIDTRSDVYALGVILYELLGGRLPCDVRRRSVVDAARLIAEHEPARLGTLDPQLRGDLEIIAEKALAKDRERRYASVAALGADLRRFLHEQPIEARPPSTLYRLTKFARRNKAVAAALSLTLLALVLGLIATTWQMHARGIAEGDARRNEQLARAGQAAAEQAKGEADSARTEAELARDAARRQNEKATAISDFLLKSVLAGPWTLGPDVKIVDVLDQASQLIAFEKRPDIEIEMRITLGLSYRQLGALDKAEAQLRRVIELCRSAKESGEVGALRATASLVEVLSAQLRFSEALLLATSVVDGLRAHLGEDDPETLVAMKDKACVQFYQGDQESAVTLLQDVVARGRRVLGPGSEQGVLALNNLSVMLNLLERYDEAEEVGNEAADAALEHLGAKHPLTLTSRQNLAQVAVDRGRPEDAEPMFRELIDAYRPMYGPEHPATLFTMHSLGNALVALGELDEARDLLAQVAEIRTRTRGRGNVETVKCLADLAQCSLLLHDLPAAERIAREVVPLCSGQRLLQQDVLGQALDTLGRTLLEKHDDAGAEAPLRQAVTVLIGGTTTQRRAEHVAAQIALATCLTRLARFAEAETVLGAAEIEQAKRLTGLPDLARQIAVAFVTLYEAWNRPERAAAWRSRSS